MISLEEYSMRSNFARKPHLCKSLGLAATINLPIRNANQDQIFYTLTKELPLMSSIKELQEEAVEVTNW